MRGAFAAALGLITVLLGAVPCAAQREFRGADSPWRHYQSPHFEVYSQAGERESRHLLRRLEMVRAVFQQTFQLREREPSEVTIFYFSNGRDFAAYRPAHSNQDTVGIFNAYIDRDVMALSGGESSEITLQILQSQFVTHLFRLNGGRAPQWLTSGAGFLFSTLTPTQNKAWFGRVDPYRAEVLKDRKAIFTCQSVFRPQIMAATEKERDVWQAHSWLFLHYLLRGSPPVPAERVQGFLRAVAEGAGARQNAAQIQATYEELLGVPFAELDKLIERYRRQSNFNEVRVDLPPVPEAETFTARTVDAAEIRLRLAELALRFQRSADGRLALLQATETGDPRIFEVLGMDAWHEGDQVRARERWQQAIDAGSDNVAVLHRLGQLETKDRFRRFDPYFRLNAETAERLRDLFLRSIKRMPTQATAYERLAWVESAAPQPDARHLNLVQSKFDELENQSHALIALAQARIRLNDRDGARALITAAEEADDSAFVQGAVRALNQLLERNPAPAVR